MRYLYSPLLCTAVHPKQFTIIWRDSLLNPELGTWTRTTIVNELGLGQTWVNSDSTLPQPAASTWMMRWQPQYNGTSTLAILHLHFTFYIYAFYPKRLTIAFRLYIFISMCVPWESNPQPFALLTQCSTTEPHRNTSKGGEKREWQSQFSGWGLLGGHDWQGPEERIWPRNRG